jgi:hypothetical protein
MATKQSGIPKGAETAAPAGFRAVESSHGNPSLFISEPKSGANHPDTARILDRNGLRRLTYIEAVDFEPELEKEAGRGIFPYSKWFYLDSKGDRPMAFLIDRGSDAPKNGHGNQKPGMCRFSLRADTKPEELAPLVVGVRKSCQQTTSLRIEGVGRIVSAGPIDPDDSRYNEPS